jgi:hypothetical protein
VSITIIKRYRPQETYEIDILADGEDVATADKIVAAGNGKALGGGKYALNRRGARTLGKVSGGQ